MTERFVGPFRVVRELGRGGMGVVYEVIDPDLGRRAALKLVLEQQGTAEGLERFWRETDALVAVRHRSVVRVYQAGDLPEGPYLLEQLIEGESLGAVCARGPLAPRRAAEVALELTGALTAVHEKGILHRDIKPSNVILQGDGIPVLLDFGIAREQSAETLTRTGTLLGTPSYMSPEQASGRVRELDARTDVYSLGALLYELLTGQAPFQGPSPMEIIHKVLTEEPVWPATRDRGVPAALDAICRRAMARARDERYATAAAMGADLQRWMAGEAVVGPARRRSHVPRAWLALGLGLAVAVVGSAWVLTRPPTPAPAPPPRPRRHTPAPPRPTPRPAPWPAPPGVVWRDEQYVNERDGSLLIRVPASSFNMGCAEPLKPNANDSPPRPVDLSAYFIGKYEVTWAQYLRFCSETGHAAAPSADVAADLSAHPVVNVDWQDAVAYCAWAGLRLPTEAEWEFAARGDTGRTFPWGDEPPTPARLNCKESGLGRTAPVGSYPLGASFAGCLDMAGNAWEWCHDAYDPFPFLSRKDPRADEGVLRVTRGGGWNRDSTEFWFHAALRDSSDPAFKGSMVGFRVARDGR